MSLAVKIVCSAVAVTTGVAVLIPVGVKMLTDSIAWMAAYMVVAALASVGLVAAAAVIWG